MFAVMTGNEIVVDLHVTDDFTKAYEARSVTAYLGGAHTFNALALADGIRRENLDGKAYMLGTISTDRFGKNFREIAAERGLDLSFAKDTDKDTLLALVQRSEHNNSFFFPNKSDNAVTATRADDLPVLAEKHQVLVMQGLCSTVKPSGDVWLDYANRNRDMMVVYDANIRLPVIDDIEAHKKLLTRWAARAQVMKVSDADIADIYGKEADPVVVIKAYLDAGASVVCMTTGATAVQSFTARGKIENTVTPMRVSNTVGAGDNFTAGLTLGFARVGLFDGPSLAKVDSAFIHAAVQSGIDQSARHLRLMNP